MLRAAAEPGHLFRLAPPPLPVLEKFRASGIRFRGGWWLCCLVCCWASSGCVSIDNPASIQRLARIASIGSAETVVLKRVRQTPVEQVKKWMEYKPPEPDVRIQQVLRRYAVQQAFQKDRVATIDYLWEVSEREDNSELTATVTLLSVAEARFHAGQYRQEEAVGWHVMALVSASNYLWSPRFQHSRNAYDPNFGEVTRAYNESLEALLRYLDVKRGFNGQTPERVETRLFDLALDCRILGHWDRQEFERIEFVSDYDVQGLTNHHQQYGVGVPLIAVRSTQPSLVVPSEKYYPPNLTLPVTAFLRFSPEERIFGTERPTIHGVMEMIDPLKESTVRVGGLEAPLATDITAPLAYFLNDPLYRSYLLATASLLNADLGREVRGLYMLEPYDPSKIPVVMVHGFWSSATTWTEMFNDLIANPLLNSRYQFWFYMYPTGQPFWVSAKQMREDLAEVHATLDPSSQSLALSQMVLVGHSMGGLISYLQTVDSDDNFWKILSDQPFDALQGESADIEELRETLFFEADPRIRRVVTLASPFHGSDFANSTTRWLGRTLLKLPQMLVQRNSDLVKQNGDIIKNPELLTIETSVDSLASDSPFFVALQNVRPAPWTRYHNLYGRVEPEGWYQSWQQSIWGEGDGVVSIESAQFRHAHTREEVDSKHMTIHQSAQSILAVRQVLLQHLAESAGSVVPTTPGQVGWPVLASDPDAIDPDAIDLDEEPNPSGSAYARPMSWDWSEAAGERSVRPVAYDQWQVEPTKAPTQLPTDAAGHTKQLPRSATPMALGEAEDNHGRLGRLPAAVANPPKSSAARFLPVLPR